VGQARNPQAAARELSGSAARSAAPSSAPGSRDRRSKKSFHGSAAFADPINRTRSRREQAAQQGGRCVRELDRPIRRAGPPFGDFARRSRREGHAVPRLSAFQERGMTPSASRRILAQPGLGRLMLTRQLVVRGFARRQALDHIGAMLIVGCGGRRRLAGTESGLEV
jgi:hypothetical protein